MGLHDAGMACRLYAVANQQLFIQFFPRAQARDTDLDITVRVGIVAYPQTRQFDHAACQVVNAHGFTHIQHKNISTISHCSGLDDQLRCLGNRHEVPGNVFVRQGNGPLLRDLLPEKWHHGPGRAQHVAKTHHGEASGLVGLRGQRLQHHFGQPLACAHDIGGPHRFVCTDQHEIGNPVGGGHLGANPGSPHVVAQALQHVVFNQRDVLVGGSMVDRLGAPGGNDLRHALFIAGRGQQGDQLYIYPTGAQICQHGLQALLYLVQRVFAQFHQQQRLGCFLHNLAAQLLADRAACSSHHDHLVPYMPGHEHRVWRYRVTPQQIFDVELGDIVQRHAPVRQICHSRQRAHVHRKSAQKIDDFKTSLVSHRRYRQQDIRHLKLVQKGRQIGRRIDRYSVELAPLQSRLVVNEPKQAMLGRVAQC